jgi:hypothetical protein
LAIAYGWFFVFWVFLPQNDQIACCFDPVNLLGQKPEMALVLEIILCRKSILPRTLELLLILEMYHSEQMT